MGETILSPLTRRSARRAVPGTVIVLLLAARPAAALQPLVTDDTGTQGEHGNQLELALNRQNLQSGGVTARTTAAPQVVFTRGVHDAADIYAGVNFARVSSSDELGEGRGYGNPVLGVKWRFYDNEDDKLSLGLKPEIQFPTSETDEARGLGSGRTGFASVLMLTQETGFGAVHVNYAFTRVNYALEANRAANRKHLHRLSVAPVVEVGSNLKLALDAGITTNPDRSNRARMGYAELGAIWSPSKDVDWALGFIRLVGDGEPRTYIATAGLTWRFR